MAEYWPRVGAAVIDAFVRLGIVLTATLVGAVAFVGGAEAGEIGVWGGLGVGFVISLAYAPWMIARTGGQTVGHRAVSTRIVNQDGSALTGRRAAIREVAVKAFLFEGIGGLLWIPTLLNYLWPLWDEHNEALHDKVCGTRVVEA